MKLFLRSVNYVYYLADGLFLRYLGHMLGTWVC